MKTQTEIFERTRQRYLKAWKELNNVTPMTPAAPGATPEITLVLGMVRLKVPGVEHLDMTISIEQFVTGTTTLVAKAAEKTRKRTPGRIIQ